jgi:hypothetical protein
MLSRLNVTDFIFCKIVRAFTKPLLPDHIERSRLHLVVFGVQFNSYLISFTGAIRMLDPDDPFGGMFLRNSSKLLGVKITSAPAPSFEYIFEVNMPSGSAGEAMTLPEDVGNPMYVAERDALLFAVTFIGDELST